MTMIKMGQKGASTSKIKTIEEIEAEKKAERLASLKDGEKEVRTSLVLGEDLHRRYKTYLAQNGLKMKDHTKFLIEECVKDIP